MAYRVEIGPSALREAEEAYLYIKEKSPSRAVKWYNGLFDAIYSLELFPGGCALAPEAEEVGKEIRQLLYGKRGGIYRILFVIVNNEVVRVLHVRHGARERLRAGEIDEGEE